jgi:plasmid stabilization system protein ParE
VENVELLDAARAEFLAAMDRYEREAPGLGAEFLDEVSRAAERIVTFPDHGSPHLGSTKRLVLPRFPFDVVYLPDTEPVVIVAIAHHRRSPGYWKDRV